MVSKSAALCENRRKARSPDHELPKTPKLFFDRLGISSEIFGCFYLLNVTRYEDDEEMTERKRDLNAVCLKINQPSPPSWSVTSMRLISFHLYLDHTKRTLVSHLQTGFWTFDVCTRQVA